MAFTLHLAGRDHRLLRCIPLLLLLGLSSASFFYFYNGGLIVLLLLILAIAIALGVVKIIELVYLNRSAKLYE